MSCDINCRSISRKSQSLILPLSKIVANKRCTLDVNLSQTVLNIFHSEALYSKAPKNWYTIRFFFSPFKNYLISEGAFEHQMQSLHATLAQGMNILTRSSLKLYQPPKIVISITVIYKDFVEESRNCIRVKIKIVFYACLISLISC